MMISGFNKCSFVDYEGKRAGVIFTNGCNMTCPYCHNMDMDEIRMDENWVLSFLEKRKGLLEGIVISGGEPCLQEDLVDFIKKVKKLGYPIKLDTNGSRPDLLKRLIQEDLIDHIAMDIKTIAERYEEVCGLAFDKVAESFELVKSFSSYEFRTTLYPEIKISDIEQLCHWLKDQPYYLQQYVPTESCRLKPYDNEVLIELKERYDVHLRGSMVFA